MTRKQIHRLESLLETLDETIGKLNRHMSKLEAELANIKTDKDNEEAIDETD